MNRACATLRHRMHCRQLPHRAPHAFCATRVSPWAHEDLSEPTLYLQSGHNSTTRRCWHPRLATSTWSNNPGDQMFTRSTSTEPKRLEPVNPNAGTNPSHNASHNPNLNVPQRRPATAEAGPKSVIGNDLKIIGQGLKIISQGTL